MGHGDGTGAGSARLRAVECGCERRVRADGDTATSGRGGDGIAVPAGFVGSMGGDARHREAVRAAGWGSPDEPALLEASTADEEASQGAAERVPDGRAQGGVRVGPDEGAGLSASQNAEGDRDGGRGHRSVCVDTQSMDPELELSWVGGAAEEVVHIWAIAGRGSGGRACGGRVPRTADAGTVR